MPSLPQSVRPRRHLTSRAALVALWTGVAAFTISAFDLLR